MVKNKIVIALTGNRCYAKKVYEVLNRSPSLMRLSKECPKYDGLQQIVSLRVHWLQDFHNNEFAGC